MRIAPAIVPHASFESLLDAVVGTWFGGQRSPVPQPVVIPSIPFSDYLQLRIANRCGVCMGIDFLTSRDFIHRATGPHVEDAWSNRHLAWRVLPHIEDYAAKLGVADPSSRDRFALASLLADQFDQYGHFRPEIIQAWVADKCAFKPALPAEDLAAEEWQRELWRKLRDATDRPHPAERFERLKTDPAFLKGLVREFPRLLVLGSGVVDPLLVRVLDLLADAGSEVEIHVLLPSMEYLGDLRGRKTLPGTEQDPESIDAGAGHPLLESMGRQAVGTFLLLGQLDDQYTHWPLPGEDAPGDGPLLRRLQADIRSLRPPSRVEAGANDLSLRVHSCFGARREMEVLKDEILRAFRDLPDLRPEEIHIVTPSLEIYAPLASAVLEQGGTPLAVRLMELPSGGRDQVVEGMLALLEVARGGRYEASWLMELLQLEAVQGALGVFGDDQAVQSLRGWIRDSGVTRGLDTDDARPGTWEFARDRLIAGHWFGTDDSIVYPDGTFVFPVADQLAGEEKLRLRFVEWFSGLEATMRSWRTPVSAPEWEQRLARAGATLFGGDDDAALAVQPYLEFLREVESDEAVDAGTIFDWLESESREAGRRAGVSGRISFGRFKQLQNIPCRVLAMVGMQDGAFPGQNRPPAWDLLRKAPRIWDRNVRIDDRQLFLDGLLTPKDRLIVTASTRNVRTKKTEPFSSCVDELLRVTALMGVPRESLVVEHRLQPFAADYFRKESLAPRSFSPEFAHVATGLEESAGEMGLPFWKGGGSAEAPSRDGISLTQLIDFWKSPARAFLRARGMAIPGEEEDDEALDRAEVTLGSLEAWKLKSAIIEEMAAGAENLVRTEARFRADRGLPPGHLGTAVWNSHLDLAEPVGRAVRALAGGRKFLEFAFPDGLRVTGTVWMTCSGDGLFAYRATEFKGPQHFLAPWIAAVFAAACGESLPSMLLDPVDRETPREYPALPREEAATILQALVSGFVEGQSRPLGFALATSHVLAREIEKKGLPDAWPAAVAEWGKEDRGFGGGDGNELNARWAWRDGNPFADPGDWSRWSREIAAPLRAWGGLS
ncbi:MAG TPA: exodeoxyribonuclease V subunit gamma [Chthoniobacterales bacterium]|nr:exodeoxyribonuclease V subunit gamma [Chthoniobacterales bacterium]